MKKKKSIFVFFMLVLILIVCGFIEVEKIIKPQKNKLISVNSVPTELYFEQDNSSFIQDYEIINKFHNLIKDKWGVKNSSINNQEMVSKEVISFSYGYKGQNLHIDSDGRIMYLVRKSDVAKQSILKWLCWHINRIYDNKYFVGYVTEPDREVTEIVKEMKELKKQ